MEYKKISNSTEENLEIKKVKYQETFGLRHSVMNPEKKMKEMYRPGDEEALHLGAFINSELVGVISFFEEEQEKWRIRGMAVKPDYQMKGVGRKLVSTGCELLANTTLIWCNARITAVKFYEKVGFVQVSGIFHIEGHGKRVRMELQSKT